jgi:hypothetical protein
MTCDDDRPEQVDSFRVLHLMLAGNIYQSEYRVQHAFNPELNKYDFSSELRYIDPVLNLGVWWSPILKTSFTADNT